jgi:hypothetical protein
MVTPLTSLPRGQAAARLQAALDHGAGCGVVGVVWGDWRAGSCIDLRSDGVVWAGDRGPVEGLLDVRLYGMSAAETLDMLALLARLESATVDPAATRSPTDQPTPPTGPADAQLAVADAAPTTHGTGGQNDFVYQLHRVRPVGFQNSAMALTSGFRLRPRTG